MPVEAAAAIVTFVGLFTAWVILPSRLRKRHANRVEETEE